MPERRIRAQSRGSRKPAATAAPRHRQWESPARHTGREYDERRRCAMARSSTTSDRLRELRDKTSAGSFLAGARKEAPAPQKPPFGLRLRRRWHWLYWAWRDTRAYLGELNAELRNVFHRMELLRAKRLHVRGITILSASERDLLSPDCQHTLLCARIGCSRRFGTMFPTATLVDHYLLISSLPHPSEEGCRTEAR